LLGGLAGQYFSGGKVDAATLFEDALLGGIFGTAGGVVGGFVARRLGDTAKLIGEAVGNGLADKAVDQGGRPSD
jgi:hypothetical protein